MHRVVGIGSLTMVSLALCACVEPNPDYCNHTDRACSDPAKPFCDIKGQYPASAGNNNSCIPDPFVSNNGSLEFETGTVNLGTETLGTTSATQLLQLKNTGMGVTGPTRISLDDHAQFAVSQDDCDRALAAGEHCVIRVVFTPQSRGGQTATLTASADPGGRATATLRGVGEASVHVDFGGPGQGRVTSDPPGIDCDSQCDSAFVADQVTLTASATGGSCFVAWTGVCSGTEASCTLTADQIGSVQARFENPVLLFALKLNVTDVSETFDAVVTNDGCSLSWEFGDASSRVNRNSASHAYTSTGEKVVTIYSPDGGNQVTAIEISGDKTVLTGQIPDALGRLSQLKVLSLHANQLSGWIPYSLGQLSNLETLYLSSNELYGQIPEELGDLSNLKILGLRSNQLTGSIPDEMSNLSRLEWLSLSNNKLDGPIPVVVSTLSNLVQLHLDSNEFNGSIPDELDNLSRLEVLSIPNNRLNGPIPGALGNMRALKKMYLHGNSLSGSIPNELGSLSTLETLLLSGNQISGSIPPSLGDLSNLETLILSDNQLSGSIPNELGSLGQLDHLSLDGNQLSGPIPDELGELGQLDHLSLGGNQLSGPIPATFGRLSNLRILSLDSNQLSGPIPDELGELTNLEQLRLDKNKFSGPIPDILGKLSNLESLNLYWNKFSGSIPEAIGKLFNLVTLNLSFNELDGTIPAFIGKLSHLQWLKLYSNGFTGVAAGVFGTLSALRTVDLRSNALTPQAVDSVVAQIYQARAKYDNTIQKALLLEQNATPSAAAMSQIQQLGSDTYKWRISCDGCD